MALAPEIAETIGDIDMPVASICCCIERRGSHLHSLPIDHSLNPVVTLVCSDALFFPLPVE